jgi:hypothetical protein
MKKKTCSKCEIEKEATLKNFHAEKLSRDGLRKDCRECRNKIRRGRREWETNKNPEYDRIKDLRRYGATVEWYEEKLKEQGDHCALCLSTMEGVRRLNVDHDHACCNAKRGTRGRACGKCNRGLLCNGCNQRLGYLEAILKESTVVPKEGTWTFLALQYLQKYSMWNLTDGAMSVFKLALAMPRAGIRLTNVQAPTQF